MGEEGEVNVFYVFNHVCVKCDMHHSPVGSPRGVVLTVKTPFNSCCTNQSFFSFKTEVTQISSSLVLYFVL